ncbi:RibD family protein [Chenggangzhangella methanolivorans]|uniref:RibD family protein n=1 Tax=Chenggangzhangella methanolivorans TaxID=1437009 RepID=A0A9E6R8I3_9HYPH|nr:RibD family protein [Chenggangzhangella methanolivorans]QZO00158.1 RibD family protein [Chenggangzhangella methanolivorans]
MKPHVTCLMLSSLDGRLGSGRSGEGAKDEIAARGKAFEDAHDELGGDGWIIGRVTGAEMSKALAHPPANFEAPPRPFHFARRDAAAYGIIVDPRGKLHFEKADIGGDHVVVLLAGGVEDAHLAELKADGASYVVAEGPEIDLRATLELLARELGVKRLLLEGGGGVNGEFLKAGVVDDVVLLIWPSIVGLSGERTVFESGAHSLADTVGLKLRSCEAKGEVVRLHYDVTPKTTG